MDNMDAQFKKLCVGATNSKIKKPRIKRDYDKDKDNSNQKPPLNNNMAADNIGTIIKKSKIPLKAFTKNPGLK